MSTNRFTPEKFHDFTIVDDNGKFVGHIRVKPSGILWAPSNSKKWYGVSLDTFAKFMEDNGRRQEK
jgi:hypothetical protein